jgi:uncharacterized protein YukE
MANEGMIADALDRIAKAIEKLAEAVERANRNNLRPSRDR